MAVAERPVNGREVTDSVEEVHFARVWLLPEGDHWVAVAPEFDIVTQAQDERSALYSLGDMLVVYLNECASEGLGYEESFRPIPFAQRVRFRLGWLRSRVFGWMRRRRRPVRSGLFLPPDGHPC